MTKQNTIIVDYDDVWKECLIVFLRHFLHLFFPWIHDDIDWKRGYKVMDAELHRIVPESEIGKRVVDKLFQVYKKQGEEALVYIHQEFQAQMDVNLPERMYIYNSSLYLRYRKPILSMAVLGDGHPSWRPSEFSYKIWGGEVKLVFPVVKLLEYKNRKDELKQSGNPFAYFILAHLLTLATVKSPQGRLREKERLVKEMLEQGFTHKEAHNLFKFIDGIMKLPKEMEQLFLNKIQKFQEEKKMPYIAPYEEILMEQSHEKGLQQGREQGREQGVQIGSSTEAQEALMDILQDRFGEIPATTTKSIKKMGDLDLLRTLRRQALKAESLKDWTRLMKESKKASH